MTTEENKAVVRQYFAIVGEGDLTRLADEVLASDYHLHFDSMPEMDVAGAIGFFTAFLTAFPGLRHEIEDQLAEGDCVATRVVVRGTHQGDFMGIPPTGREVAIKAINIQRVEDGRIAEQWVVSDSLGLLQQLGAIPAPAA